MFISIAFYGQMLFSSCMLSSIQVALRYHVRVYKDWKKVNHIVRIVPVSQDCDANCSHNTTTDGLINNNFLQCSIREDSPEFQSSMAAPQAASSPVRSQSKTESVCNNTETEGEHHLPSDLPNNQSQSPVTGATSVVSPRGVVIETYV